MMKYLALNGLSHFWYISELRQKSRVTERVCEVFPSLRPLTSPDAAGAAASGSNSVYMMVHELGHCLDFVNRGAEHRLYLNRFGFVVPSGRRDIHNESSAQTECRAIAYSKILLEKLNPISIGNDLIKPESIIPVISSQMYRSDVPKSIEYYNSVIENYIIEYKKSFDGVFTRLVEVMYKIWDEYPRVYAFYNDPAMKKFHGVINHTEYYDRCKSKMIPFEPKIMSEVEELNDFIRKNRLEINI